MLEILMSTGFAGASLILAIFITYIALRETRKKYVHSTSIVLREFTVNANAGDGEPYVHIVGRYKGIIAWLLYSLGIENRVELKVTSKDWTLRSSSLTGMSVDYHPLKSVNATVCGYQRSVIALFFTVFFGLSAIGSLLSVFPIIFALFSNHSEAAIEAASKGISSVLVKVLISAICWGIAFLIFYLSKRVSFGVEAGGANHGIVFKRSVIENQVVELEEAEAANALINQLLSAAVYGVAASQIPMQKPWKPAASRGRTPWIFIAGAVYLSLVVLIPLLSWYGDGVDVRVATTPPGAVVYIDNNFAGATQKDSNLIDLTHLTREDHSFVVQLEGYQRLETVVHVGGLRSTQYVGLQLVALKYPLTVYTSPAGAHITIDGKDAGATDSTNGKLTIPEVDHGKHQIKVSIDGYRTYTEAFEVDSGPRVIRADLVNVAQAAQREAQAKQQEAAAHLDRGRMFFRQGQYQQAIDECDAVLRSDPSNAAAAALKSQVAQTKKVLGQ